MQVNPAGGFCSMNFLCRAGKLGFNAGPDYRLADDFSVVEKRYLGDADEIAAKMNSVAAQGAAKKA